MSESTKKPTQDATVADARKKLDESPEALDAVVTKDGKHGSELLGWLTSLEIARMART